MSGDRDQTGRMHRLTLVFAGRTSLIIDFVVRRLKFFCSHLKMSALKGTALVSKLYKERICSP